jgi:hypothetical protein
VPYHPARKARRFRRNLLGTTYIADDFDGPLPHKLQKYLEQDPSPHPPRKLKMIRQLAASASQPRKCAVRSMQFRTSVDISIGRGFESRLGAEAGIWRGYIGQSLPSWLPHIQTVEVDLR